MVLDNRHRCSVLVLAGLALLIGGCAQQEARTMDAELAAAGFRIRPASTPEELAQLKTMTPLTLMQHEQDGRIYFVMADPDVCRCLYVGNEHAYQRYQRIKIRQDLADERLEAASMNDDASMNWNLWGPWGPWGPP